VSARALASCTMSVSTPASATRPIAAAEAAFVRIATRAPGTADADPDRGIGDDPRCGERITLAGQAKGDAAPAAGEVGDRDLGKVRRAAAPGDRERPIPPADEHVGRGSGRVIARAARELAERAARRVRPEPGGDRACEHGVRWPRRRGRFAGEECRDDDRTVGPRGHRGVRECLERRNVVASGEGRQPGAQVPGWEDRTDGPALRAERARVALVVDPHRVAFGERDQAGVRGQRDGAVEGARVVAEERGSAVIRGDDDAPGAIGVDGGQHPLSMRRGPRRVARASSCDCCVPGLRTLSDSPGDGDTERVLEDPVDLRLPVDVRSGGHPGQADRRDDLPLAHALSGADEDRAGVVVALLQAGRW